MFYELYIKRFVPFLLIFIFGLQLVSFFSLLNHSEIPEVPPVQISSFKGFQPNKKLHSNPSAIVKRSNCVHIDEDIKKYRYEEINILIDKIERERKSKTKHKFLYIRFVLERSYLYSELNLIRENNSDLKCFKEIKQIENRIEDINSIVKWIENSKNVDSLLQKISNFEN